MTRSPDPGRELWASRATGRLARNHGYRVIRGARSSRSGPTRPVESTDRERQDVGTAWWTKTVLGRFSVEQATSSPTRYGRPSGVEPNCCILTGNTTCHRVAAGGCGNVSGPAGRPRCIAARRPARGEFAGRSSLGPERSSSTVVPSGPAEGLPGQRDEIPRPSFGAGRASSTATGGGTSDQRALPVRWSLWVYPLLYHAQGKTVGTRSGMQVARQLASEHADTEDVHQSGPVLLARELLIQACDDQDPRERIQAAIAAARHGMSAPDPREFMSADEAQVHATMWAGIAEALLGDRRAEATDLLEQAARAALALGDARRAGRCLEEAAWAHGLLHTDAPKISKMRELVDQAVLAYGAEEALRRGVMARLKDFLAHPVDYERESSGFLNRSMPTATPVLASREAAELYARVSRAPQKSGKREGPSASQSSGGGRARVKATTASETPYQRPVRYEPTATSGWYPDPEDAKRQRYWDGQKWTDRRAPLSGVHPPSPQPASTSAWNSSTRTVTTNGLAVASMVMGIAWLYWVGSASALVLGYMARRQIDASSGTQRGRAMAVTGIALGWIGIGVLILFVIFGILVSLLSVLFSY